MNELVPLLEKLAQKLGVTVEYIFKIYVKQAWLTGVTDIIQYALLALGIWVWWKYREKFWPDWDEFSKFPWGIAGVGLGFILLIAFFCFPNTIAAFINPEYWALEKLLGVLRGLK